MKSSNFDVLWICETELNKEVSAGSGVRALGDFGCPQETLLAPAAPPMVGLPGNQLARLEFTTQLATAAASTHPAKVHLLKPRSDLITFGPCDFFGCDAT